MAAKLPSIDLISLANEITSAFQRHSGDIRFGAVFSTSKLGTFLLLDEECKIVGLQSPNDSLVVTRRNISSTEEKSATNEVLKKLAKTSISDVYNIPAKYIPFNGLKEVRQIPLTD